MIVNEKDGMIFDIIHTRQLSVLIYQIKSHMNTFISVFYGKVLREQVKEAPDDPYENEIVRKYTMQILHTMKVTIYF